MANGNLFYNETLSILYGTVSLKDDHGHANERKVPETHMKDYCYYYYHHYYHYYYASTRNFRMRESVIESLSQ